MSTNISFFQNFTAGLVVDALTQVRDSEFNPVNQNTRIRIYACVSVPGTAGRGVILSLSLGNELKGRDIMPFVTTVLSTRDHLLFEGAMFRGTKFNISGRNEGTAASIDLRGMVVLDPA